MWITLTFRLPNSKEITVLMDAITAALRGFGILSASWKMTNDVQGS